MEKKVYNRLINEKSPYLLQHADNPVDWFPWCEEAFNKAAKEDKPILLSIGYSTCHWCHVMAHESFCDISTAEYLNENFISIKVDREERPDIDDTYMLACHLLSNSGGWPLNVIMTPDKIPFFAGTYFPLIPRYNMPSFLQILKEIQNLWSNDKNQILEASKQILSRIKRIQNNKYSTLPDKEIFEISLKHFQKSFDKSFGGFGNQPKFPMPHYVNLLLVLNKLLNSTEALAMAEKTLECMHNGGIFDHVGGGFHRYSVDREWLVPHFEKMLYDQSLIAVAYIQAYQLTKKVFYAKTAQKILNYVLKELKSPQGAFYSGTDADSEGEEGKFFVWKSSEIDDLLQKDATLFKDFYDITINGNFEHATNILNISKPLSEFAQEKSIAEEQLEQQFNNNLRKLYKHRSNRIHPHLDDKIITGWNGLTIKALALAGKVFKDETYINAAIDCSNFIDNNLLTDQNKLLRRYRDNESAINAFLEDYAFLAYGLLELYEATFSSVYLKKACEYIDIIISDFYDKENKSFFSISKSSEIPLVNLKEAYDGAIPSAQSILAIALLKLADIKDNKQYLEYGEEILAYYANKYKDNALGYAQMFIAVAYYHGNHNVFTVYQNQNASDINEKVSSLKEKYFYDAVIKYENSEATSSTNKCNIQLCNIHGCQTSIESIESISKP